MGFSLSKQAAMTVDKCCLAWFGLNFRSDCIIWTWQSVSVLCANLRVVCITIGIGILLSHYSHSCAYVQYNCLICLGSPPGTYNAHWIELNWLTGLNYDVILKQPASTMHEFKTIHVCCIDRCSESFMRLILRLFFLFIIITRVLDVWTKTSPDRLQNIFLSALSPSSVHKQSCIYMPSKTHCLHPRGLTNSPALDLLSLYDAAASVFTHHLHTLASSTSPLVLVCSW